MSPLPRRTPAARTALAAAAAAVVAGGLTVPATAAEGGEPSLHLVTLAGGGVAAYDGPLRPDDYRTTLTEQQDDTLATLDGVRPVYRWTTALNGFAAELTEEQVADLVGQHHVASVEPNAVLPLAALEPAGAIGPRSDSQPARGGAGTVIGVIDTGIWPESPLFAASPRLGRSPEAFRGRCVAGRDWGTDTCDGKIVGARWFVAGFGTDNLRSTSSLSPRDDDGHGSQVASVAAGNHGVSVQLDQDDFGSYGGAAPQARLAVYKACWSAPDPSGDGCASADVVTAIDRATGDGVDVLNLSVAGSSGTDAVGQALLGAAEADVVVVAAAGNDEDSYAAHQVPWVTTVGGIAGAQQRGRVALGGGTGLEGAMTSTQTVGPSRLVRGADAAADGADPAAAAECGPGSLDAGRVAGRIVVCERGTIGRVDKSAAVALADGIGMVLVNSEPGAVSSDVHEVPTVHLDRAEGRRLGRALAADPDLEATLRPTAPRDVRTVTDWSSAGDPRSAVVKPDVVAPASGVLGSVPPHGPRDLRWSFFSGTSAAAATVSGQAATVRSRQPEWSATAVRSALATSATGAAGRPSPLRQGAGITGSDAASRPGLVFDVTPGDYRRYLEGRGDPTRLNTPSVKLERDNGSVTRTVTNVGDEAMYYSVSTSGFVRHDVSVTPAAIRIAPGESREFRITVRGDRSPRPLDDGWVTWRGADDTEVRVPVVISR